MAQGPQRSFDVFLSHASVDRAWTEVLAGNLSRLGLEPFFDEWEILPGDIVVPALDRGLRTSHCGVLVTSPEAFTGRWVQQEYAALVAGAVNGTRPLIPVLYRDAEIPPFLSTYRWIDFRGLEENRGRYLDQVGELAHALRAWKEGRGRGPRRDLGFELELPETGRGHADRASSLGHWLERACDALCSHDFPESSRCLRSAERLGVASVHFELLSALTTIEDRYVNGLSDAQRRDVLGRIKSARGFEKNNLLVLKLIVLLDTDYFELHGLAHDLGVPCGVSLSQIEVAPPSGSLEKRIDRLIDRLPMTREARNRMTPH
ncbi:MAG: toll/interleukin-1 receptor domain-containing protein [Acidobacteriota bacterium]